MVLSNAILGSLKPGPVLSIETVAACLPLLCPSESPAGAVHVQTICTRGLTRALLCAGAACFDATGMQADVLGGVGAPLRSQRYISMCTCMLEQM